MCFFLSENNDNKFYEEEYLDEEEVNFAETIEKLSKANILKEVVKNANGEPCMTESFVKVYKASATKYKYTTYHHTAKWLQMQEKRKKKRCI